MNLVVAYSGLALEQLMHRGCDIPCRSQNVHRLCYVAVMEPRRAGFLRANHEKEDTLLCRRVCFSHCGPSSLFCAVDAIDHGLLVGVLRVLALHHAPHGVGARHRLGIEGDDRHPQGLVRA